MEDETNKDLVLLVSSGDWGDEFDLEGFAIFYKETWEIVKDGIPDRPFDAYYGSNETVTFEDKADYLKHIKEKDITVEEAKKLCETLDISFRPNITDYGLFVIRSDNY